MALYLAANNTPASNPCQIMIVQAKSANLHLHAGSVRRDQLSGMAFCLQLMNRAMTGLEVGVQAGILVTMNAWHA